MGQYSPAQWGAYLCEPHVVLGESETTIPDDAFRLCTELRNISIPQSVTSIGTRAFESCTALTAISLPAGVSAVPEKAFYSCTSLTSIEFEGNITSIGAEAFKMTAFTNFTVPDGVTSLGSKAFEGSSSSSYVHRLSSIYLPDSLTELPSNLLYGQRVLASVRLPAGLTKIGNSAFSQCSALSAISFPDTLTHIESWAFAYASLTHIFLPQNVNYIGGHAFYDCTVRAAPGRSRRVHSLPACRVVRLASPPAALSRIGRTSRMW